MGGQPEKTGTDNFSECKNKCLTIGLFVYDFPHRKSFDFLMTILAEVKSKVILFAAPKKKLDLGVVNLKSDKVFIERRYPKLELMASQLENVEYYPVEHSDFEAIATLVKKYNIRLGVIAGARIISGPVISLFEHGIVNFHPGKLPETSGLDSLYYTIMNNVSLGVTAHFINSKVDAGEQAFFYETQVSEKDTFETLEVNNYTSQLNSLSLFLEQYTNNSIVTKKIVRPSKNPPMDRQTKKQAIDLFESWKAKIFLQQCKERIYRFCKLGDLESLIGIKEMRLFINAEIFKGWTPLVVASYNQHIDIVKYLIELGADVNYSTAKGTTVLMYAKTNANVVNGDIEVIKLLMRNGADPFKKDIFGKDIFFYLHKMSRSDISSIIQKYSQIYASCE